MFYIISEKDRRVFSHDGKSAFTIKEAMEIASLIRRYDEKEKPIIVNAETGTYYKKLEVVK